MAAAKAEAEQKARKQIEKVIEPMLSDLEHALAKAHELIVTLDEYYPESNSTGDAQYLKDERFAQSVGFLTKRLGASKSRGGMISSGSGRPGRKINDKLKKADKKTLTIYQIADQSGLSVDDVANYIKAHPADYEVKGENVTLKK
jgi:hypothetical protein